LIRKEFEEAQTILKELGDRSQDYTKLTGGECETIKKGEGELNFITPSVFKVETDAPEYGHQNRECMLPICFLAPVDSPQECLNKINASIFGTTTTIFTS
jgi:acyl-CoA reductase-like NAD-dependent aldehyde dehydrogenase